MIDRNERVGDSWRNRYRTLMTHDPIHYCHLPFVPFPADWPMFMPKDKLADWLESYATIMELNIWTSTTIGSAEYDDKTKTWAVEVQRADGSTRTLRPRHVILATGQAGDPITPTFPNQSDFKGMVYHGSQHQDASVTKDISSKKVVVVGSGNSSHDICQNFHESGAAQVTMVQRGGSYVITADKGIFMMHKGMYEENGPPTEDADVYGQSIPTPILFALSVHGTKAIAEIDRETLDGLTRAGFKLDFGVDGSGIYRKYITRGGGYYIDVGCSKLIADGKVKVHHTPKGVSGFTPNGLALADGTTLEADIVVLATGYDGMKSTARKIFGDKVASRLKECWDLDEQGEINSIWRSSGHPGFWYTGGNLALCRYYSRLLALQIKALEEGIYTQTE
nr:flavin-binding monooxygenase [Colletotrichum truncatum]KAF6782998.1 flavin-binding monooxygenase [Colletotrichum truncatum]